MMFPSLLHLHCSPSAIHPSFFLGHAFLFTTPSDDTIVSGKKGWKRKAFDLNGVAQTLQTALEEENRQW